MAKYTHNDYQLQGKSDTSPFLTQRQKLDNLLSGNEGAWVSLPDVQALGIAQHGARLNELRKDYAPQGYKIENKMERGRDGIVRSWYRKIRLAANERSVELKQPQVTSWEEWDRRRKEPAQPVNTSTFELVP